MDSCPSCNATRYNNPNLQLLVNVCGHAICDRCVEQLFVRGSGQCPRCAKALKRTNFRTQFFDDSSVDREVQVRKRVLKDLHLRECDFPTLADYNDYLERVERFIANLVAAVDVDETQQQIKALKQRYQAKIARNKTKPSAEETELGDIIREEQHLREKGRVASNDESDARRAKQQRHEMMLDELAGSELPAETVVRNYAAQQEDVKPTTASLLNRVEANGADRLIAAASFAPVSEYRYEAPTTDLDDRCGPAPPSLDDIIGNGYLNHIRDCSAVELVGGFRIELSCLRAVTEAMDGLFRDIDDVI